MHTMTNALLATPCSSGCGCCGSSGCGCGDCSDPVALERTRFYPRQLIGPDELTQDQRWIRDKLRRHNRLIHGWGVVCGCDVRQAYDSSGRPIPWTVVVQTGDVLGPFGDEIVVDVDTTFDVRLDSPADAGCAEPADPWCSDVRVSRVPRRALYLAIRYDERLTRPVRTVGACGCGDDHSCEYSRIRESFALTVLDELPAAYRKMAEEDAETTSALVGAVRCSPEWSGGVRPCPPCPTDPWVVLADIVADSDGMLTIDPVIHRRYVASFATYWFSCLAAQIAPVLHHKWSPMQKAGLLELIDPSTIKLLEEQHDGDLDQVSKVAAGSLLGVSARSAIGKHVRDSTIADIAATTREEFVASSTEHRISAARAGEVWDAARKVVSITTNPSPP